MGGLLELASILAVLVSIALRLLFSVDSRRSSRAFKYLTISFYVVETNVDPLERWQISLLEMLWVNLRAEPELKTTAVAVIWSF